MNVPSGYTALDMVGFTDKGPYNSATAYVKNDIAHYGGNLWRCLVDDTTNVTPTEGANWTVFLAEPTSAAEDIIAPVEASAVSTRQYAVGKQLILNDTLYRVTAAVNIGDTLIVDTNIALSDTVVEQLATKANTSSLATVATSGSYVDLSNQPTLGTAAAKDVPASGNASTTEVVMGDDTRLSDARNAADVYSWAKASTKPTYNGSEINTSAAQTGTAQSAVAATIASGTSMDAAVKDLLDNDVTLSSQIGSVNEALTNEVEAREALGAHNLLENLTITQTNRGITQTVNADGSLTYSGSFTTGYTYVSFTLNNKQKFKKGNYKLSGAVSSNANIKVTSGFDQGAQDSGNGANLSLASDSDTAIYCFVTITDAATLPLTIKPMIRLASDTDPTYQPYAMTNRELTERRVKYAQVSGTLSATQYHGYYYADIPITLPTGAVLISAIVTTSDSNNFVTVQGLGPNSLRVYGGTAENNFTIRYAYI